MHNTTIFSLVLSQVIAIGVFGLKESSIAAAFTIPLIICTLLFNEYCRQRFHPIFKDNIAQVLIEMDRKDEENGKMEEIHKQLHSAYCQLASTSNDSSKAEPSDDSKNGDASVCPDPEDLKP
ncbi:CSC1-like protein rxw8, partial [Sarracenia purpurea var. burkii]